MWWGENTGYGLLMPYAIAVFAPSCDGAKMPSGVQPAKPPAAVVTGIHCGNDPDGDAAARFTSAAFEARHFPCRRGAGDATLAATSSTVVANASTTSSRGATRTSSNRRVLTYPFCPIPFGSSSSPVWPGPPMEDVGTEPRAGQQQRDQHRLSELFDGDAGDVGDDHFCTNSMPASLAISSCSAPGRCPSVLGSSCQIHHAYGSSCG